MSKRLYIGGLPYATTDVELAELFAPYGVKEGSAFIASEGGRSKGFGFIEVDDADAAIAALDGSEFGGRKLLVNEARPKPERRDDRRSSGGYSV